MARIPDADIERLKQEVSLQRLVEAQGRAQVCLSTCGETRLDDSVGQRVWTCPLG
jgi:hypothetical protein